MTSLETANLINDYCRAVAEHRLLEEEWQRFGRGEMVLTLEEPYVVVVGMQLVRCLESQGIDTKELRRFQRVIRGWSCGESQNASSLWDNLELDLEGIALRLEHGAGTKPAACIASEPPAENTKRRSGQRRPQSKTDQIVADYLAKHPHAKIAEIVETTGCSTGSVQKSAAWQDAQKRRKASQTAAKSEPRVHQLRNEGEASILADNREPADALIDEEDANTVRWRSLVEAAPPNHRAVLNRLDERQRTELLEYHNGHTSDEVHRMIRLIAEQSEDQSSERRGKSRSRERS